MYSGKSLVAVAILLAFGTFTVSARDCPKACTLEFNQVCATNGKEYRLFDNPCMMDVFNCEHEFLWTQTKSLEPCLSIAADEFNNRNCYKPCTFEYNPVCGFNGEKYQTFGNLCDMNNAHCDDGKTWSVANFGSCEVPQQINEVSKDIADCVRPCGTEYSPICATFDGEHYELFNNVCDMHNAECGTNKHFKPAPFTACVFLPKLATPTDSVCEKPCTREYFPVCGTDGKRFKVFSNECALKNEHCNDNKLWTETRMSNCGSESTRVIEDIDCEKPCTFDYVPVCGTNGELTKVFGNKCVMENEHCKDNKIWTQTRMDQCEQESQEPILSEFKVACEKPCTFEYMPVCGTNGEQTKLFGNKCVMENEHCNDHKTWVQTRMNECQTEPIPIAINSRCEKPCTFEYMPVCGTNGEQTKLFGNKCVMENEHCNDHKVWVQTRMNECQPEPISIAINTRCEKPCTFEYMPVCGTNGEQTKVFGNKCVMENEYCNDHKIWVQTRMNECQPELVPAAFNTGCEKPCTREYNPVCGTNGNKLKVFSNKCLMENEHCHDGKVWLQARMEQCQPELVATTTKVLCEKPCTFEYMPTCGFNGLKHEVFPNKCALENAHCKDGKEWFVTPFTECIEFASEEKHNCEKPCNRMYKPVCGFDGENHKIFSNKCVMENEHCRDGHEWNIVSMSVCDVKKPKTIKSMKEIIKKDCPSVCPFIFLPTCGSNGKTHHYFANPCEMQVYNCRNNEHFVSTLMAECENKQETNVATRERMMMCPSIYNPQCGFDGTNYRVFPNECMMDFFNMTKKNSGFKHVELSLCKDLMEN
ncbi:ovoinhibitor-like [Condylostylus longicornis]|uniref:ovoinhibitor-like n=1 Tax=Condylostylus longicornis TaxID=2530218 RepID=UPI00244DBF0A|nr:ovoinhibitor-like [Condylostylus longicornis]